MKKIYVSFILPVCLLVLFGGCNKDSNNADIPDDFSFSLVWDCYGISSYDSESGKLVKTTDATHPEDYITELNLSEEQRNEVWKYLSTIDLANYPESYDPNEGIESSPSMTLILTVTSNGESKTITCKDIAMSFESSDKKAQQFLDGCIGIINLLTNTDEWNALPDYEFHYE